MENAATRAVHLGPVLSPDRPAEPARDERAPLRLARTLVPADFGAIARFGRVEQSRLDALVDGVMSRLEAGRAIRERVRRDTREMARLEPKLPSIGGAGPRSGLLGYLLDAENRLSNHYDRVQVRLDGLVPRLNDGSARLITEIGHVEELEQRIGDRAEELGALVAAARFRRDEIAEDDRPPAIDGYRHRSGPVGAVQEPARSEQLDRLETRIGNLGASHALALRLVERLRVTRHDLERLYEHLQTGLFDLLPRWNERLQDAIVELRRRQTANVGRQIEHTLRRCDSPPDVGPTSNDRAESDPHTDPDGGVGLHLVDTSDRSREEVNRPVSMAGTAAAWTAAAKRGLLRSLAPVGRRVRSALGLPATIGSSGLWWS